METLKRISCTLIPQDQVNILLPNSAIEEITKARVESSGKSGALGQIGWRNTSIPVISLVNKSCKSAIRDKASIIVVVKSPDSDTYVGLVACESPRSIQANQRMIEEDYSPAQVNPYASRYVVIDDNKAIIPDLGYCFSSLHQ